MKPGLQASAPASGPPVPRAAPREEVVLLAFLSGADGEAITQGVARTLDISPRGAGLITPRPIKKERRVQLELLLPSKLRLQTTGRVVHSSELRPDEWRVGIAFDRPPELISSFEAQPESRATEE